MLTKPLVIHGPQGCGKTRNAAALAKHFEATQVVDDWAGRTPLPCGTLALTNSMPPSGCPYQVISYSSAIADLPPGAVS